MCSLIFLLLQPIIVSMNNRDCLTWYPKMSLQNNNKKRRITFYNIINIIRVYWDKNDKSALSVTAYNKTFV